MPWRSSTLSSSRSVIVTPSRKLLSAGSCSAAPAGTASMARWKLSPTLTMSRASLRDGVLGGLLLLALRPLADVLDLRMRPQALVLEVGDLRPQRGDQVVGVLRGLLAGCAPAGRPGAPPAAGRGRAHAAVAVGIVLVPVGHAIVCIILPRFGSPRRPAMQRRDSGAGRGHLVMPDIMQTAEKIKSAGARPAWPCSPPSE